jgi:hypothetical protein
VGVDLLVAADLGHLEDHDVLLLAHGPVKSKIYVVLHFDVNFPHCLLYVTNPDRKATCIVIGD